MLLRVLELNSIAYFQSVQQALFLLFQFFRFALQLLRHPHLLLNLALVVLLAGGLRLGAQLLQLRQPLLLLGPHLVVDFEVLGQNGALGLELGLAHPVLVLLHVARLGALPSSGSRVHFLQVALLSLRHLLLLLPNLRNPFLLQPHLLESDLVSLPPQLQEPLLHLVALLKLFDFDFVQPSLP